MSTEKEHRQILGILVMLSGMIVAAMALSMFVLFLVVIGEFGHVGASVLFIGYATLGYAVSSVGLAFVKEGYNRAFWQLLGYDFSPDDTPGETA